MLVAWVVNGIGYGALRTQVLSLNILRLLSCPVPLWDFVQDRVHHKQMFAARAVAEKGSAVATTMHPCNPP